MKNSNKLKINGNFNFSTINNETTARFISTISDSSGAGISELATKIIKSASTTLIPILTRLFNMAITTSTIPNEWKTAVVSPIYKNKGAKTDPNSYRGISVLPPIANLFEKIMAEKITHFG
jgi:hypothetical protein